MERKRNRCENIQDSHTSPVVSILPLRDQRCRPFKVLTPKRVQQDLNRYGCPEPSTSTTLRLPAIVLPGGSPRSAANCGGGADCHHTGRVPRRDRTKTSDNVGASSSGMVISKRKSKSQLCSFIHKNEFGSDHTFSGPFGPNLVTYLDYTASGRPLRCIESYIQRYVLPTYSNTHTEVSHNAKQTTAFREEARDIIKKSVNASEDDCVIFTGSGVTSAINKLVHCLNIEEMGNVVVFIGPYEHHSNILPWLHSKAQIIRIPQDKDGLFDINALALKLEDVWNNPKRSRPFIIGAFSAASNVTGIITPTYPISCLIHRYNGFVFWDYACAAPYVPIDMNPTQTIEKSDDEPHKDAVYISPHKFVGGPGTPGILVAKRWLFRNPVPHDTGGGTVLFVRRAHHVYIANPEHREEGGTPAILESIRCGLVFKLKDAVGPRFIMKTEEGIFGKAVDFLQTIDGLCILGNTNVHRLPILSFLFYNSYTGRFLHHDFVATVFNDLFGLQVRSGCACAGPYGLDLMGMSEETAQKFEQFLTVKQRDGSRKASRGMKHESYVMQMALFKPGFVRLNLPYFITDECMDFVLKAVRLVALHGWSLLPQYKCDVDKGGWTHIGAKPSSHQRLEDVSFASGTMTVQHGGRGTFNDSTSGYTSESNGSSEASDRRVINYETILKRAEGVFYDAMSGLYDCERETVTVPAGLGEELMWFMTPKEAADLIHKRKRRARIKPEDLPFMPGALAVKLGISPLGHQGRSEEMDYEFPMEYHPLSQSDCDIDTYTSARQS